MTADISIKWATEPYDPYSKVNFAKNASELNSRENHANKL